MRQPPQRPRSSFRVAVDRGFVSVLLVLLASCSPTPDPVPLADGDEFQARAAALRERLPDDFHVVVQRPFVVVGDEAPQVVERRARSTVAWAVRLLRKEFFERDPDRILDIWLFRDERSYERNTRAFFDEEPRTPFGYYSPRHSALIMNIATGGGTLVHEIVHPFVRANFPDCPAWFNEGLGSLYEQCHERDGRIHGLTNWRLAGLQEAIRGNQDLPFSTLLGLTDEQFYGDERGLHYAQARYLCYYLQQRGLLRDYYRRFVKGHADDPTGLDALRQTLECDDLGPVQEEWRDFVLALNYPEAQD